MALDPEYLDAIKKSEGYTPAASWDFKQYSSGYGTKAQPGDENIPPEQLKAIYEQRFQDEIAKAAAHVDTVAPNLPPGVRAALTSLTYNAGPGWSQSGLGDLIRAGDYEGAQSRFLQYNKAGGEVNPGLSARRQREAAWFGGAPLQPVQASPAAPAIAPPPSRIAAAIMGTPQAEPAPMPRTAGEVANQIMGSPPPEMAMQPISIPQRRAPDLSKLRAAFPAAQIFRRG